MGNHVKRTRSSHSSSDKELNKSPNSFLFPRGRVDGWMGPRLGNVERREEEARELKGDANGIPLIERLLPCSSCLPTPDLGTVVDSLLLLLLPSEDVSWLLLLPWLCLIPQNSKDSFYVFAADNVCSPGHEDGRRCDYNNSRLYPLLVE